MSVLEARCSACHAPLLAGGIVFGPVGVLCRACDAAPVAADAA